MYGGYVQGNGNTPQYSCLGKSTGRGAWWAIVHGVAKSRNTTEQLNNNNIYKTMPLPEYMAFEDHY